MMNYYQLLTAVLFLNTACSDFNTLDMDRSSSEKLLQGQLTNERSEVVKLSLAGGGLCTGTVIKPNVILTAAHCIDYQSAAVNMGVILTGQGREYRIQGGFSFSQELGRNDVALLHLSESLPSSEVMPAAIHVGVPSHGSRATIYGFGCNDRRTLGGHLISQKQKFNFVIGEGTSHLCPGDSGGPVFVNNAVAYVNSAYYTDSGDDVFAEPSSFHEEVNRAATQIAAQGVAQYMNEQGSSTWESGDTLPDHGSQGNDVNNMVSDECEESSFYNDGICDTFCSRPDPDCSEQAHQNDDQPYQNDGQQSSVDECEQYSFYGDGICDTFCSRPDPDCNNQGNQDRSQDQQSENRQDHSSGSTHSSGDECEDNGYYGDGFCDLFCEQPDLDC